MWREKKTTSGTILSRYDQTTRAVRILQFGSDQVLNAKWFLFIFFHKNWLINLWSSICGIIDKKLSVINGIGYQMDQHEKCDNAKRELTYAF